MQFGQRCRRDCLKIDPQQKLVGLLEHLLPVGQPGSQDLVSRNSRHFVLHRLIIRTTILRQPRRWTSRRMPSTCLAKSIPAAKRGKGIYSTILHSWIVPPQWTSGRVLPALTHELASHRLIQISPGSCTIPLGGRSWGRSDSIDALVARSASRYPRSRSIKPRLRISRLGASCRSCAKPSSTSGGREHAKRREQDEISAYVTGDGDNAPQLLHRDFFAWDDGGEPSSRSLHSTD